jgi:hypothetical protein
MNNEFWIAAEFASDETEQKFKVAINACYTIHLFTLKKLNNYFLEHAELYHYAKFRGELNRFILENKKILPAQRYSLQKAAEMTFPYFNKNKKFSEGVFVPVVPLAAAEYHTIQIQTRQIWERYLALNSLITTVYGTVYLSDQWTEILQRQAAQARIDFEAIPLLWHSITLTTEVGPKLKFNLHPLDSKFNRYQRESETYARL